MTRDTTDYEETTAPEIDAAPPLCLVRYFAERSGHLPSREAHGRVAERRGNLIILEFAPPPTGKKWGGLRRRNTLARVFDILLGLLLLASLVACVAAFRF